MMNRSAWIVLAVVILIAAVLFITQSQSLSNTQSQLATAQIDLTQQSDDLRAQATAALVTATQAAVAQAESVSDAQDEAATAQAQAISQVEEQAATMQAVALADAAEAAATTQAAALAAAQSDAAAAQAQAVEDAESQAATAQAEALADAQQEAMTVVAQAVEQVQNRDATAQAQIQLEFDNQVATAQAVSTQAAFSQVTMTAQAQSQFALQETVNALRNQLATAQAASTPAPISTPAASLYGDVPQARLPDGGFVLGNPDASITVVEFGDYACPHCQSYEPTITQFIDNYVRTGKARFEFRILPTAGGATTQFLGQIQACLEEQRTGAFWEARHILTDLAIKGEYSETSGEVVAEQLSLNYDLALECSASNTQMQADFALAQQSGVQGTPAVLTRRGDGTPKFMTLDGTTYDGGGVPYEVLAAVVDASVEAAPAVISREGWKRFEGNGVALQLPESWVGGDLANNPELLADAMAALGPEYAQLGQIFLQNPDVMRLMVVDTASPQGFTTNVNAIHQELPFALDLSSFMEITANQLPSNMTVLTNEVIETGFGETGRLVSQGEFANGTSQSVQYVLLEDNRVWVVTYTASAENFENMLPVFEASFETLEFQTQTA